MDIQLKALGLTLTDGLARYCQEHVVEPIERIFDRSGSRIEVELSDENGPKGGIDKRCRITFAMPYTRTLTVVETADDIYRAVDLAARRLRRLVNRYKHKKLEGPRYPHKYYAARLANAARDEQEAGSPEEITQEDDSLSAREQRERLRKLQEAASTQPS